MRTTLEIDDDLHELARRIAFEQRRSLGDVVSELMRQGLAAETKRSREQRPLGIFAGLIHIAEDFDDTPPDVIAALDEPLG
jgi:hypothetical protein